MESRTGHHLIKADNRLEQQLDPLTPRTTDKAVVHRVEDRLGKPFLNVRVKEEAEFAKAGVSDHQWIHLIVC
jgi:hypothetical protein